MKASRRFHDIVSGVNCIPECVPKFLSFKILKIKLKVQRKFPIRSMKVSDHNHPMYNKIDLSTIRIYQNIHC